MAAKIQIVCAKCRSADVSRDATARWDPELQDWDLASVQDQGYCDHCEGYATLVEVPLQERIDELNSWLPGDDSIDDDRLGEILDEIGILEDALDD